MKILFAAFTATVLLATSAMAQPANHNSSGMREACAADIATHCAGVQPGQQTMQCVQKNRDKMSDGCKSAMAAMRQGGGMGGGMGAGNTGQMPPKAQGDEKKPQ